MQNDKELFRKFARGECTEEEAKAVQAYIDEHPDELDNQFPLNDWLSESKRNLDPDASERILQHVRLTYEHEKRVSITKILLRYVVAASLIGIAIFSGTKWLQKTEKVPEEITFITKIKADTLPALQTVENSTNQVMALSLPDGSRVTMYPRSVLRYFPAFEKDKRELLLKGKALFKVSKDRSRPFTVYADGIATTALGTLFLVSEMEGRKVSIALMEGSIKVWAQQSGTKDAVILQPGDKLTVNSEMFKSYSLEKKVKEKNQPARGEITVNKEIVENAMVFKNDRLEKVFTKMAEKFDITIHFEAVPGIEEELFTGTFLEDDSLEFVCKTICNLHGLQYRKDGNVLTILRQ